MRDASAIGLSAPDDAQEAIPGVFWWTGWVSCPICGYGAEGHEMPMAVSVAPIPEGQSEPFLPECPTCRNATLSPCEGPHR